MKEVDLERGSWRTQAVHIPISDISTCLPWYFKDDQNAEREAYQSSGVFFLISPYISTGIFKDSTLPKMKCTQASFGK